LAQNPALASKWATPAKYDEAQLRQRYQSFLSELNYLRVATDYPKAIKELLCGDLARQQAAISTLAATGEIEVVPWLVLFLDAPGLEVYAGSALEKLISGVALKRRDQTKLDRVALRPLKPGEMDLRPLSWIALKMFRMRDDGNVRAEACGITRYVEAKEFEGELRSSLQSRHPAVTNAAKYALEGLGFKE
jgi:hypothetical protein